MSSALKNPTQGQVDSLVPGQLAWPDVVSDAEHHDRQYLVNAPPNSLDSFTAHAGTGMFLAENTKLYKVTSYQGLRGTFIPVNGVVVENTDALMRYQLWEQIGYAADPYADSADTIFAQAQHSDFQSNIAIASEEEYLPAARSMYFWDGHSRDHAGDPKLTLYYSDGQGKKTTGSGEVGVDFYEMKLNSVADDWVNQSTHSGTARVGQQGSRGGGGQIGQGETALVAGVEANAGGASATDDAYKAKYATTLAWQRLSDWRRIHAITGSQARRQRTGLGDLGGGEVGFVDTEAHNTMYELYRPKMLDVVGNVFRNESRIGQIGGSPDTVQSRIQANLRNKLVAEGFTRHWIDVFFAEENILTITPEGFDLHGTNQSRRPIPAGTDPATIKSMRMNPGDYTTYPAKMPPSPPASRVVVHAPFGYIVPPSSSSPAGARGGPPNTQTDEYDRPHLLQRFPANYTYAGYTLHTLSPRVHEDDVYYFDYAPNNVSYQGLGAQWVEIPRAGDLPIVEFASWSLMKVSMDFLIANTATSSDGYKHPDGLVTGIHEKIEALRRMAQRPYPVSIFGMDQLLRLSMRRAEMIGKPLEFVISDINISSMRRTIEKGDKEITTAQVKMTLQEIPIEDIKSVRFSKPNIVVPFIPPDPAGSLSIGGPPLHEQGEKTTEVGATGFTDEEAAANEIQHFSDDPDLGVNTASNENAVIGGGQADIVHGYEGYDEWGMTQGEFE